MHVYFHTDPRASMIDSVRQSVEPSVAERPSLDQAPDSMLLADTTLQPQNATIPGGMMDPQHLAMPEVPATRLQMSPARGKGGGVRVRIHRSARDWTRRPTQPLRRACCPSPNLSSAFSIKARQKLACRTTFCWSRLCAVSSLCVIGAWCNSLVGSSQTVLSFG